MSLFADCGPGIAEFHRADFFVAAANFNQW
jgi:hypothetical protein